MKIDELFKAAEAGDANAQNKLGFAYYYGEGVEQDYNKAIEWYTKAAEQGHLKAQFTLAMHYEKGKRIEQSYEKAAYWYKKAAEQGHSMAQYNLGNSFYNGEGVEQNFEEAVYWFTQAAEQGEAYAQFNLGNCFCNGEGVEQDYAKAVEWYTKAAEQGEAYAQYNLGVCYYNGEGVEQDLEEAAYWYKKAAEQGYADAQINLALCYDEGDGVEQNSVQVVYWLTEAAKQDHPMAKVLLGYCYYKGNGVEHDHKKAQSNFKQVIDNKQADSETIGAAYYYLGMMCIDRPFYVFKDNYHAKEYFEKAVEHGYDCRAELDGVDSELNITDNPRNKMGEFAKNILAKKAPVNEVYEEVEKTLKSSFAEIWDILSKESKMCLITGCVAYISFASSGEEHRGHFDYSSIIAAITKACEIELGKVLYYGFRDYLEREKIPPTEFDPETQKFVVENKIAVPKYEKTDEDEEYNYFKQKKYERTSVISYVPRNKTGVFTLGGFPHLAGIDKKEQFAEIGGIGFKKEPIVKTKKEIVVDKHFLAYMNEVFKDDAFSRLNRTEEMKKYLFDLKVKIENIAFNLRNPASHDTVMPFWKAVYCGNSVFMDNYFLQDFLRKIKH